MELNKVYKDEMWYSKMHDYLHNSRDSPAEVWTEDGPYAR